MQGGHKSPSHHHYPYRAGIGLWDLKGIVQILDKELWQWVNFENIYIKSSAVFAAYSESFNRHAVS